MLRLNREEFVMLACLADYNFKAYEILSFAAELGYDIPLQLLFPTLETLMQYGLITERVGDYPVIVTNPEKPIFTKQFTITSEGEQMLLSEMEKVDLLVKRIRKQVRVLKE